MAEQMLEPIVRREANQHIIQAPKVGVYSHWPQPEALLAPGSYIGSLKVLRCIYHLHLPTNLQGRVVPGPDRDYTLPMEYGQELFRIEKLSEGLREVEDESGTEITEEPMEEGFVVRAFTNGIFYQAPSPDAPPFVNVGQKIHKGKTLGLIEVMKTFNYIIFQGTDVSANGEIKRIYVNDSQEVKQGQPLFLIGDV